MQTGARPVARLPASGRLAGLVAGFHACTATLKGRICRRHGLAVAECLCRRRRPGGRGRCCAVDEVGRCRSVDACLGRQYNRVGRRITGVASPSSRRMAVETIERAL